MSDVDVDDATQPDGMCACLYCEEDRRDGGHYVVSLDNFRNKSEWVRYIVSRRSARLAIGCKIQQQQDEWDKTNPVFSTGRHASDAMVANIAVYLAKKPPPADSVCSSMADLTINELD
jgi:hypothetical protein